ncbi:MAG: restriction endonuclease subunit S [Acidimicrobiia bacterium]
MTHLKVPLLDVADLAPDRVQPFQGTRPYVATGDLHDDGRLESASVTYDQRPSRANLQVRAGDVCLARMRGTTKVREFSASDELLILSTGFVILRARAGHLEPAYLRNYLLSCEFQTAKDRLCTGAIQPAITNGGLAELEIPLPPIEEQRRIAAVLDAADALRAKRRQAIAKLDTLTEAIFIDMFVKAGTSEWTVSTIDELAAPTKGSIRTGPFGSQLLHSEFTDAGVAVLGIDNAVQNRFAWGERRYISHEKYENLKRYTVFPGDVLVTIMATCGRVAVVPDGIPTAINTKHLCCITLDQGRCLPDYLWGCLSIHPDVRRQLGATRGAVMPGLNMGIIGRAEIPVPPLSLQGSFAGSKSSVDRRVAELRDSESRLDTLFASLQQRAFRGEL